MAAKAAQAKKSDPRDQRVELIKEIENLRGSSVICFLTSLRPGAGGQMAEDSVRVIFDHLLMLRKRPVPKLDIFLCSNGGATTVPWRLVSLFREFSKTFSVIVPYRAYSAATMLALGADEIVMHPFGELGPIDPTVSNDFNPVEDGTNRRLGISVEDVKAYVTFVKSTVGITHEDELVKALEVLAQKVHPLALGNVERFISQSRMMGQKIMRTHMSDSEAHIIDDIVENLASKLYFHGHPINRVEAKKDLKLKIADNVSAELESAIWKLYQLYEGEFKNTEIFNPASEIAQMKGRTPAAAEFQRQDGQVQPDVPQGAPPIATQAQAQPQIPPELLARLAHLQAVVQSQSTLMTFECALLHAMIESTALTSRHTTQRRWSEINVPGQPVPHIKEDVLSQGWTHSSV